MVPFCYAYLPHLPAPAHLPMSLEDVDRADGTLDLPLLVGPLHCYCYLHNHVEEVSASLQGIG